MAGALPMTLKQTQRNMNAPIALLSAVYEGITLPTDRAVRIESKYFAKVAADPQAANMVRSLFVNKQAAERGGRRPKDQPTAPTKTEIGRASYRKEVGRTVKIRGAPV